MKKTTTDKRAAYFHEYHLKNKERINKNKRLAYLKNKEKILQRNRLWQEENIDKYKEYQKQYYSENKEKYQEYQKQYYIENKSYLSAKNKTWRIQNKESLSGYHKKYIQEYRDFYLSLKFGKCCKVCGETCLEVLDFHHRKNEIKLFNIACAVHKQISRKRLLIEISKCDVLCSNCHRKLHYQEKLNLKGKKEGHAGRTNR